MKVTINAAVVGYHFGSGKVSWSIGDESFCRVRITPTPELVHVQPLTVEVDVPDNIDLTGPAIKSLLAQKASAEQKHEEEVAKIEAKVAALRAATFAFDPEAMQAQVRGMEP